MLAFLTFHKGSKSWTKKKYICQGQKKTPNNQWSFLLHFGNSIAVLKRICLCLLYFWGFLMSSLWVRQYQVGALVCAQGLWCVHGSARMSQWHHSGNHLSWQRHTRSFRVVCFCPKIQHLWPLQKKVKMTAVFVTKRNCFSPFWLLAGEIRVDSSRMYNSFRIAESFSGWWPFLLCCQLGSDLALIQAENGVENLGHRAESVWVTSLCFLCASQAGTSFWGNSCMSGGEKGRVCQTLMGQKSENYLRKSCTETS